ncbi:MAG: peptidase M23 [Maricaulis sp.]|nr:peptidase M23 [Maricaulis sp.]HAQ36026.1 peptidase M23 [Alphaproteobacteria bacterium]
MPSAGEDVVPPAPEPPLPPVRCQGEFTQGAMIVCRTAPGTRVDFGDQSATADSDGWVVLGLDRDQGAEITLSASLPDGVEYLQTHSVTQREYNVQVVEGVPQRTVTPSEADLVRIREEGRRKAGAYTSRWEGAGFASGFIEPADGVISGVYGSQRVYNGTPGRPHYGLDFANAPGTPVVAPAAGLVTLADADMFYEGGLVFIDHGQGFTSAFLHMSAVDVEVGQVVAQGERIGAIGAGGRSTGPHLDWRIKWRNRYIDPALVLEVDPAPLR